MLRETDSRPGRLIRRPPVPLLAAFLLGLSGCGWLYNYEGQMASEQQRVERFDEQNEHLDAPLEIPKPLDPKDKKGQKELEEVPPVFVRPPKGIQHTPDKSGGPGPFAHYVRDSQRATTKTAEQLVYTDVYVATAPTDQKEFKDFRRSIVNLWTDTELRGSSQGSLSLNPLGRPPLLYDLAYRNPSRGFALFFCQRNGLDVAIAFKLQDGKTAPKVNRTGLEGTPPNLTVTELSLESFGVGKEASELQKAYDLRRRHKK